MREVVYLEPGTTADERSMKLTGTCPKCGERLSDSRYQADRHPAARSGETGDEMPEGTPVASLSCKPWTSASETSCMRSGDNVHLYLPATTSAFRRVNGQRQSITVSWSNPSCALDDLFQGV